MNKTKKLMAGVATSVMAFSMSGCGQNQYESSTTLPPEPTEYDCDDWEWDDNEGTYYCDDRKSSHFGAFFLLGSMFSNRSALRNSPNYASNLSKYKNAQSGSSSGYKSGIGSGSKGGFGG
jgi:uncharacterized lipoprotein YehR (DUF1307 family)